MTKRKESAGLYFVIFFHCIFVCCVRAKSAMCWHLANQRRIKAGHWVYTALWERVDLTLMKQLPGTISCEAHLQ